VKGKGARDEKGGGAAPRGAHAASARRWKGHLVAVKRVRARRNGSKEEGLVLET